MAEVVTEVYNISVDNGTNITEAPYTRGLYKVVVPAMLTACVLSVLLNLAILSSAHWVRRPLSPTMCFSLSLAVADAYASLFLGIGLIVNSLLPFVYDVSLGDNHFCYALIIEGFRMAGPIASVLHFLALAVNHYLGILRPLHYASTVTRHNAAVAIALMWIIPLTFFFLYFASVTGEGFQSSKCLVYSFLTYSPFRVTVSFLFFCPLVLMTMMYIHMFFVIRQHQFGLLDHPCSRQYQKNIKALMTTLLILGTYLLGWMPAVIYYILTCIDCAVPYTSIPIRVRIPIGIFINSLVISKSLVDPFIYAARMPELKEALQLMVKSICQLMRVSIRRRKSVLLNRTDTATSSMRMVPMVPLIKIEVRNIDCNLSPAKKLRRASAPYHL